MRQIVLNELNKDEAQKARGFLDSNLRAAAVIGLYWLQIPQELRGEAQAGHELCGPFAFAVELGDDFLSFELLVRSESNLHCSCTAYATPGQRDFLLALMDRLVNEQALKA